jgi:hypothetical protein
LSAPAHNPVLLLLALLWPLLRSQQPLQQLPAVLQLLLLLAQSLAPATRAHSFGVFPSGKLAQVQPAQ